MAISNAVIRAFAEDYSEAQIRAWRAAAMEAHAANLPRVELTGLTMDGAATSGLWVDKDPLELIELFTAILDEMGSGGAQRANEGIAHGDFSRRPVGW